MRQCLSTCLVTAVLALIGYVPAPANADSTGSVTPAVQVSAVAASLAPTEDAPLCGAVAVDAAGPVVAKSGCCSWHGGVCGCSGNRAQCCDGAASPSCGCVVDSQAEAAPIESN
jgi:hypothetical protein